MKTKIALCVLFAMLAGRVAAQQIRFDDYFERQSLRFDFILAGDAKQQYAYLDGFRKEPVWGGPLKNLIERFDYGEYAVELYDKATNRLIFSTHFGTLFQEWRTTAEAKTVSKAFHNAAITPFPKKPAIIKLLARENKDMKFGVLFEMEVDPQSIFIDHSKLNDPKTRSIQYNGSPNEKVDLVFVAEGYTERDQEKFYYDVKRLSDSLFTEVPFNKRRNDFNVWAVGLVSDESKTDYSGKGVWSNTALNSGYWTFGLDRYLTTADYKSIRNAVWNVPCDAIIVLVNTETYGGGGIYNHYAMTTADDKRSTKVFVHEFGHSFGGLADEYFESTVAYDDSFYNLKTEPWEPNITTLVDFDKKWKDLLPKGTPIPTQVDKSQPLKIGVYEGGGYLSKGIYRPADRCMMRDYAPFCPACQRSINRVIDFLCDR